MKRTINFKAVLILTAGFALFGIGVHLLHGFQVSRHSRGLIEQANQAERDGQLDDAARYLVEYLGLTPNDAEAQCRYALMMKKLAKTPNQKLRAYYGLENVLRRYSDRDDVRRAAAELGLIFGRFEDAKRSLEPMYQSSPRDAELVFMLGRCEAGLSQSDKATRWFVMAADLVPEQIKMSVDAATFLRSKRVDRPSIADEVMNNMANRGRPVVAAREAAARYFAQHNELNRALIHAEAGLAAANPPPADLLILAAEIQQGLGRRDEVRKVLDRGQLSFPRDARFAQRLAQLDLSEGHRDQAKARMESVAPAVVERPEEIFNAANTLIELGEADRARELIIKLEANRATVPAHVLRGRLAMKQSEWNKARGEFEKARAVSAAPALAKYLYLWLGQCYERLGCTDQALGAYRQAVANDRTWESARLSLAEILAATGQLDRAIEEYRSLVADVPAHRLALARLLLAKNERLPERQRDYSEVEQLIKSQDVADKNKLEVNLLLAELARAKGKPDEARSLLQAECQREPKRMEPRLALFTLEAQTGSADSTLKLIAETETQVGPKVEWDLARIRVAMSAAPLDRSPMLRALEPRIERYPAADAARLQNSLADAYAMAGDAASAERLWRAVAARAPEHLHSRFCLFEAAIRNGNNAETDKWFEELRRIEGTTGPIVDYCDAARMVARAVRGDAAALNAARAPLARSAEFAPSWSRVLTLQGQVLDMDGKPEKALEKYQEAIERGDARLGIVRRVLQLLYQQRRFADANVLVKKISSAALPQSDLGRMAAQLWMVSPGDDGGDPKAVRQKAMELAQQSVKPNSTDHREYLWLGMMSMLADQPAAAEKAIRHARQLEPNATEVWVALVTFLARTDPKKAEAELAFAKTSVAPENLPAVMATSLEALGRLKEADVQYKEALKTKAGDPVFLRSAANFFVLSGQNDLAVPLLRKLVDPATKAPESIVPWARRTLAMTIASGGDYRQYRDALALIEANGTSALVDRIAKTTILAMQPANRRDAIRAFEESSAQVDSIHPDVRFLAAQLYEADGQWDKARSHFRNLLAEHDKNAAYQARYIRGLLRHDGADEAAKVVDKLAAIRPDAIETAELKARVLKAQNRPVNEAAEPIRAYAQSSGARLDLAAAMLEDLGITAEAEAMTRRLAESSPRPEAVLVLAGYYSRNNRMADAMNLLEKAWSTCPPEAAAASSVAALRTGGGDAAQYQKVEGWITSAIAKNPNSEVLLVVLAMMYEANDRPNDAVSKYQQVLRNNPRSIVALNNLACLYANRENRTAEALTLINQAMDLTGPDTELLDSRAMINLKAGQAESAMRDIQQAISQSPSPSPRHLFRLGQAQFANKNRVGAAEAITKAKKLGLQAKDLPAHEKSEYQKLCLELKLD